MPHMLAHKLAPNSFPSWVLGLGVFPSYLARTKPALPEKLVEQLTTACVRLIEASAWLRIKDVWGLGLHVCRTGAPPIASLPN